MGGGGRLCLPYWLYLSLFLYSEPSWPFSPSNYVLCLELSCAFLWIGHALLSDLTLIF